MVTHKEFSNSCMPTELLKDRDLTFMTNYHPSFATLFWSFLSCKFSYISILQVIQSYNILCFVEVLYSGFYFLNSVYF